MTPGERNDNPGNIKRTTAHWAGMRAEQTDPVFVQFKTPEWGIRAIVRILVTYHREGVVTPRQIISRWAPPTENDTSAYIDDFCRRCSLDPDEVIAELDAPHLQSVVTAIIIHENGRCIYSAAQVAAGIAMALAQ